MSFDLYLHGFCHGHLAPANRDGVLLALQSVTCAGTGGGRYRLTAADGSQAEFAMAGLDEDPPPDHCGFSLRSWTPGIIEVIYRMAELGKMVITPVMEGPLFIVTSEAWLPHLPPVSQQAPPPAVCRSSAELAALLDGGVERWNVRRARILQLAGGS